MFLWVGEARLSVLRFGAGVLLHRVAADCGQLQAVKLLLEHSAGMMADVDCNGCSAMDFARDQGHTQIIELLQQATCPLGNKTGRGLHIADPTRLMSHRQLSNWHARQAADDKGTCELHRYESCIYI